MWRISRFPHTDVESGMHVVVTTNGDRSLAKTGHTGQWIWNHRNEFLLSFPTPKRLSVALAPSSPTMELPVRLSSMRSDNPGGGTLVTLHLLRAMVDALNLSPHPPPAERTSTTTRNRMLLVNI